MLNVESEIDSIKGSSTLSLNKSRQSRRIKTNIKKNSYTNSNTTKTNEHNCSMEVGDQTLMPSPKLEVNTVIYDSIYNSNRLVLRAGTYF